MKWGLILTDLALWEAVADDIRHATHSVSDRVRRKYDGRLDREQEEEMVASVKSGPDWFGRTTILVAGVGIGLGVGLLFAPQTGREAREAIRDRAEDLKDRITDAASRTVRFSSAGNATGTNGD